MAAEWESQDSSVASEHIPGPMDNVSKRGGLVRQQTEKICHDYLTERLFSDHAIANLETLIRGNRLPYYNLLETQTILEGANYYQAQGVLSADGGVSGGGGSGISPKHIAAIRTVLKGRTIAQSVDALTASLAIAQAQKAAAAAGGVRPISGAITLPPGAEPLYTTYLEPIPDAEAAALLRSEMNSTTLLTFHVHIHSENRVTIHLISTSHTPFTYIINPFLCPDVHLTRHNGDIHYFAKKLAYEIYAISQVRPFRVGENFTVSYDLIFTRSVDSRGGGYHSDTSMDGNPFKFISLEYFMRDHITCASAEILLDYPSEPGGQLIDPARVRAHYLKSQNLENKRVSIRTGVNNGSMIAFQNDWNQHATPGFGSTYVTAHSDALSNVEQSIFGTTVYPAFRLEHSFKRNDPMGESPPQSGDEDESAEKTPDTEEFEGYTIPVPSHNPQIENPDALFGSGLDRIAPLPTPPPPEPPAGASAEDYVDEGFPMVPRDAYDSYPHGSYPAYKNDGGTTIQYDRMIAIDNPPGMDARDIIDISDKLESTFVTEMTSLQIEAIIYETLNERRSFIRGSWTVSVHIDVLTQQSGPDFRVLRMPNGWIFVPYIDMGDMDDALHTIGGGTSSASKSRISKPPIVGSIPNSVFPNVYVSDIYSLKQIKPSKLGEYIEMENKFKRLAKKMRGGRKHKKSNRKKKTKKRSKKQTRKRFN